MARKNSSKAENRKSTRTRTERKFPALTFQEAIPLAEAIQKYAAGQKVRRLTLFEKLDQSPDSAETRRLITGSGQYGLTKGGYQAEYLELTPQGNEATNEEAPKAKQLAARFELAIRKIASFNYLYEKVKGNKLPAKEVLADYLAETEVQADQKAECIDTFTLNAKFLGLLRTIAGSERIIPIEQALEETPQSKPHGAQQTAANVAGSIPTPLAPGEATDIKGAVEASIDFSKICFYITPIGEEASEERRHADFFMEYIVKPAVKEFNLEVVRADQMGKPGMIGKQVVEHILKARLVVADLSFHNPNVFYELCLRHTTRLPTVQIKRTEDKLPFDLNQYRTISIETRDAYTLVPKLQTHTAEVANQVRRALQDSESGDNPISLYYPSAKLSWDEK
ncbi:MAG: hypothetical protein ABR988_03060 [Terriglobales bacterium]|jgi:hypothetical protein